MRQVLSAGWTGMGDRMKKGMEPVLEAPTMFAIDAEKYGGLAKVVEEAGEACQAIAKLMATFGEPNHWDGSNLDDRIRDELADLAAAIDFTIFNNGEFDWSTFTARREKKKALFLKWSMNQPDLPEKDKRPFYCALRLKDVGQRYPRLGCEVYNCDRKRTDDCPNINGLPD